MTVSPGGAEKFRSAGDFLLHFESPVLYFPNKLYVQLLSCSYNKERTLETMEHPARKITKIARETERLVLLAMRGEHIGTAEIDCIHAVRHHPGITQTELAAALNTDKPAIARRTASLERKGYLRREPNPADGRSQLLYPTDQAQNLRNAKAASEDAFYEYLLSGLDQGDREKFSGAAGYSLPPLQGGKPQRLPPCERHSGGIRS